MTTLQLGTRRLCGQLLILTLVVSCSVATGPTPGQPQQEPTPPQSAADFLELANNSPRPLAMRYRITAAERLLLDQQIEQAREVVAAIPPTENLPDSLRIRLALVLADLALASNDPEGALDWLNSDLTAGLNQQDSLLQQQVNERRSRILLATDRYAEALLELAESDTDMSASQKLVIHNQIWQTLQKLSDSQLSRLADNAESYQLLGWLELARTMRAQQHNIPSQLSAISRWQSIWTRHSAADLLPGALQELDTVWSRRPRHIALLLPMQEQIGRAVQEGFFSAYYQAMEIDPEVPRISVFDTSGLTDIRGLYESAVASGADLIIGPLNKELVRQLDSIRGLPVPTLALNYTDFNTSNSELFYQFGLAPEDEIRQVANRAWASGYRNAAIVAPDSADYARLQQAFSGSWEALGGNLVSAVAYGNDSEYSDTIKRLLAIDASEDRAVRLRALLPRDEIEFTPTRRGDIDFIFLIANPRQGRQIKPTLAFYFAEDIPVYALSAINDGGSNRLINQDLNGIVFTDAPWVLEQSPLKQEVNTALRPAQGPLQRLRALGVDSFRIYARLDQLASGQLLNFRGTTGQLSMTDRGIIERTPQTAIFIDGQAVVVDSTDGVALN